MSRHHSLRADRRRHGKLLGTSLSRPFISGCRRVCSRSGNCFGSTFNLPFLRTHYVRYVRSEGPVFRPTSFHLSPRPPGLSLIGRIGQTRQSVGFVDRKRFVHLDGEPVGLGTSWLRWTSTGVKTEVRYFRIQSVSLTRPHFLGPRIHLFYFLISGTEQPHPYFRHRSSPSPKRFLLLQSLTTKDSSIPGTRRGTFTRPTLVPQRLTGID